MIPSETLRHFKFIEQISICVGWLSQSVHSSVRHTLGFFFFRDFRRNVHRTDWPQTWGMCLLWDSPGLVASFWFVEWTCLCFVFCNFSKLRQQTFTDFTCRLDIIHILCLVVLFHWHYSRSLMMNFGVYSIYITVIVISIITHWSWVRHICLTELGHHSFHCLKSFRLIFYFTLMMSDICISSLTFLFRILHLKMSSVKRRPLCFALNDWKKELVWIEPKSKKST